MRRLLRITQPSYRDRLLQSLPLALWMQQEQAGSVAYDATGRYNGVYSGVTLGQPGPDALLAAGYDGAANCDIVSCGTAFSGVAGAIFAWARTSAWTDGVQRFIARVSTATISNLVYLRKQSASNQLFVAYGANGTYETVTIPYSNTNWFSICVTWDKNAGTGEFKVFVNGTQYDGTQVALGVWFGAVTSAYIGTSDAVSGYWSGQIGPVALYNRALTAREVASLSKI